MEMVRDVEYPSWDRLATGAHLPGFELEKAGEGTRARVGQKRSRYSHRHGLASCPHHRPRRRMADGKVESSELDLSPFPLTEMTKHPDPEFH